MGLLVISTPRQSSASNSTADVSLLCAYCSILTGEQYTDILTMRYMRWLGVLLRHPPSSPGKDSCIKLAPGEHPQTVLEMGKTVYGKESLNDADVMDGLEGPKGEVA